MSSPLEQADDVAVILVADGDDVEHRLALKLDVLDRVSTIVGPVLDDGLGVVYPPWLAEAPTAGQLLIRPPGQPPRRLPQRVTSQQPARGVRSSR